ncbi:hypothetical protein D9758_001371 [Tetrapyrgos nigripes]|uniref:DUF6534 domain-containing protein n=1 Tax=Tetrapyrgos nigripes TaxID=182062 RepID=A0A8H5LU92_9AGAR|nr:hypothetical protein D9758_001371 [Tetrapyrgos nigripes]
MQLVTWIDLTRLKGLSMTVNVLGAVADVIIAAGLFYFLHRSRTGFRKSDTIISKLIVFSVSTGLLTSICAIASLLSILIWGQTLIYVAFYFSLGRCLSFSPKFDVFADKKKVYSNSLLATLNARQSIRGIGGDESEDISLSLRSLNKSRFGRATRELTTNPKQTNISIKIDTTQEMVRDAMEQDIEVHEFLPTADPV